MIGQLLGGLRLSVPGEITRGADNGHPHVRGNPHRNHILRHLFAQAHPGIETPVDDVRQTVIHRHFHIDIRVLKHKGFQHRPQDRSHGVLSGSNTDIACRFVAHVAQGG